MAAGGAQGHDGGARWWGPVAHAGRRTATGFASRGAPAGALEPRARTDHWPWRRGDPRVMITERTPSIGGQQ